MRIGILGATGPAGQALAARAGDLGHDVWLGSRDAARAEEVVGNLRARFGERVGPIRGVANGEAAERGEIVVIAVPWQAAGAVAADAADALSGKIVISMANALERRGAEFLAVVPPEGSVAAGVAKAAPESRVVAAFHHVAARELGALDQAVDADVLVCSDDRDAAEAVCDFVRTIPRLAAIDVGGLANAVGIEAFTAVLMSVNRRYKVRTGVRLMGLAR